MKRQLVFLEQATSGRGQGKGENSGALVRHGAGDWRRHQERREGARQRQTVIAANAELQERELIKLALLASALAAALRRRGVADPAASLAAEAGIAVFKISFERWLNETDQRDLSQLMRASLDELKAVTAGK